MECSDHIQAPKESSAFDLNDSITFPLISHSGQTYIFRPSSGKAPRVNKSKVCSYVLSSVSCKTFDWC